MSQLLEDFKHDIFDSYFMFAFVICIFYKLYMYKYDFCNLESKVSNYTYISFRRPGD